MQPYSFDLEQFRRACSNFPTGVTITTVLSPEGTPHGITVSSFTSVSLDPPLVLICIDQRSRIQEYLQVDRYIGINVLNAEQQNLSRQFSSAWNDRFVGVDWYSGLTGVPMLCDVPAAFECQIAKIISGGDHVVIMGRVLHVLATERMPLAYLQRSYGTAARAASGQQLAAEACRLSRIEG
jgi:3-hydroxy-9,10-secoandrosta-1,3,5(10)-triene-9,17-dione monooxygenase reductase component